LNKLPIKDKNYIKRELRKKLLLSTSEEIEEIFQEFKNIELIYSSALKEVYTKLDILNNEFKHIHSRNPIENITTRIKSPESIIEKLLRKNLPVTIEAAKKHLNDIAGIRIICTFLDDIYQVVELLTSQNDITTVKIKDYITHPKPNGYRSLHLIVQIPVFFSDRVEYVNVEVQLRTEAMDVWASIEHKLAYKGYGQLDTETFTELKNCSEQLNILDNRMHQVFKKIETKNQLIQAKNSI